MNSQKPTAVYRQCSPRTRRPEYSHFDLEQALFDAARSGRVDRALEFIDAGADAHALPPEGARDQHSLGALAAVLPDLRLLRTLIAHGVDLNHAHAGVTPLLAATRDSWHGRPDAVTTLLAGGRVVEIARAVSPADCPRASRLPIVLPAPQGSMTTPEPPWKKFSAASRW